MPTPALPAVLAREAIRWNGRDFDKLHGLDPNWRDDMPPDDYELPPQLGSRVPERREVAQA